MTRLSDEKKLVELSIPGTHQSMAYVGGPGYWAQCNVMTIETQLKSGIRAFDIRLRPTGGRLAIHHGKYFQKKNVWRFSQRC